MEQGVGSVINSVAGNPYKFPRIQVVVAGVLVGIHGHGVCLYLSTYLLSDAVAVEREFRANPGFYVVEGNATIEMLDSFCTSRDK